jgi:Tol biopolymer transport system component
MFVHSGEIPQTPAAPVRFQVPMPANATTGGGMSPDGTKIAYLAGNRLWVHFLDSGESRDLTDTDHGPFWSADSRFIVYGFQNKLKKIEATGGPPQTITDYPASLIWGVGAWNKDDVIVFGNRTVGLFRVPASGGVPVQITAVDRARHENAEFSPSFLPDGRHFVFPRASTDAGKSAIYVGSIDATPDKQSATPLLTSNSQAVYSPSNDPRFGYLLFVREGALMAQLFDYARLELKGQAMPVVGEITPNRDAFAVYVPFSASRTGAIAFLRTPAPDLQFTWYDREGKAAGNVGESGDYSDFALSADGDRVIAAKTRGADQTDLWLLDLTRGAAATRFLVRCTRRPLPAQFPRWRPHRV